MLEKDTITYLHPEKFVTRRAELLQKRPLKQLALDQDSLTVKEKPLDMTCSTRTELELVQAFRRRALAFDLVGLATYELMNSYHAELLSHMQEDPPPGYTQVSVTQVLRADRAVFSLFGRDSHNPEAQCGRRPTFRARVDGRLGTSKCQFSFASIGCKCSSQTCPKAQCQQLQQAQA